MWQDTIACVCGGHSNTERCDHMGRTSRFQQGFAIKACSVIEVLVALRGELHGLSVSSAFEAKLAPNVVGSDADVHFTSALLRADECNNVMTLCNRVTLNSLGQVQRLGERVAETRMPSLWGLGANPALNRLSLPKVSQFPCDRPTLACAGLARAWSVRWRLPLVPPGDALPRTLAQKGFLKYLSVSSSPQYSTSLSIRPRTLCSTTVAVSGRRTDSGAMPARIAAITPTASQ